MLPDKSWSSYESIIKNAGEHRKVDQPSSGFLQAIGFVNNNGSLDVVGNEYFVDRFIRGDHAKADFGLRKALLKYRPVEAICQQLVGVKNINKKTVETVLRSQKIGTNLNDRSLGSLLMILNKVGIVDYNKKDGLLRILETQNLQEKVPDNIFISPEKPYTNRARLRQIIAECEGHIYWLDKHFMPVAFEDLNIALDGNKVTEVHILSLALEGNSGKSARKNYRELQKELKGRSINLEWRVIASEDFKNTHDRWIIGENTGWNIPDVNTIYSGKNSELHRTKNFIELKSLFEKNWPNAKIHFPNDEKD